MMRRSTVKCRAVRSCVLLLLLAASIALGQQLPPRQDVSKKQLEEAYAEHDIDMRHSLAPYSGPPLLLDLSHVPLENGMCDPAQHVAWENYFHGLMGDPVIADKGVHGPYYITMTSFTTIDTFAPIYSLPAKGSNDIVIAKVIAGRVCIPQNHRYVYTKFTLDVVKDFRKRPNRGERDGLETQRQITAAQFGGSLLFPSGFLETYLLNHRGFLEIGKEYVLFMWNPVRSDDMLVVAQAYLIQDGLVFPVSTDGDAQTVYTKMPFPEFEAKVKLAVARNIDADVFPDARKKNRH
jgi:hypothetical protein